MSMARHLCRNRIGRCPGRVQHVVDHQRQVIAKTLDRRAEIGQLMVEYMGGRGWIALAFVPFPGPTGEEIHLR